MASGQYHPQIYTYLKKYQEEPGSRVFAPLAEAYRKAGLVDDAIDVAREGLRFHPNFIGGRVALARALFDKQRYAEVIDGLLSVVQDVPDNLVAQRLVADSCLMLGRVAEALSAYKMLLYFSPEEKETAQIVQELEAQAYEKGSLVVCTDPAPQFEVKQAGDAFEDDPDAKCAAWVFRIEFLQSLLQKVERYRAQNRIAG